RPLILERSQWPRSIFSGSPRTRTKTKCGMQPFSVGKVGIGIMLRTARMPVGKRSSKRNAKARFNVSLHHRPRLLSQTHVCASADRSGILHSHIPGSGGDMVGERINP